MAERGFRHTKAAIELQCIEKELTKLTSTVVSLMHLLLYDCGHIQLAIAT